MRTGGARGHRTGAGGRAHRPHGRPRGTGSSLRAMPRPPPRPTPGTAAAPTVVAFVHPPQGATKMQPANSTARRRGARIAEAVTLVIAGALPLVWSIAAIVSFVSGDDGGEHRFHDLTGTGVVLGVLWLGAVLRLARRGGRRPAALAQLLGIGVAAALATALSGESPILPAVVLVP